MSPNSSIDKLGVETGEDRGRDQGKRFGKIGMVRSVQSCGMVR